MERQLEPLCFTSADALSHPVLCLIQIGENGRDQSFQLAKPMFQVPAACFLPCSADKRTNTATSLSLANTRKPSSSGAFVSTVTGWKPSFIQFLSTGRRIV
jgi:hypothetical protein